MSFNNQHSNNTSRSITSNQEGIHPDLEQVVQRHLQHSYQRPIPEYVNEIFKHIQQQREKIGGKLIVDAGCGTGQSTLILANQFPDDFVLGIDQSEYRLDKINDPLPENILLIRANLIDIWLLMQKKDWKIDQHYLFYPNPWPKKKHLQRRWHGHPIFPVLLNLTINLELRSNWKIYVEEFSKAVEIVTGNTNPVTIVTPSKITTPFEEKYLNSGQVLYQYQVFLSSP